MPATYELSVTGGVLIDDAQQTITARESVTGTVATTATGAETTAATTASTTTTTTTAATTTAGTGREGEPGGTYTVQTGDTLALIARDIYGDFRLYEQLCAFNNIADCNVIEVGQVINLPTNEEIGATGTTATTTTTTAAATPAATVAATTATTSTTATTATTGTTTTGTTTTGTTTTATTAVTTTTPVTTTGTTTGTTTTSSTTGSTGDGHHRRSCGQQSELLDPVAGVGSHRPRRHAVER